MAFQMDIARITMFRKDKEESLFHIRDRVCMFVNMFCNNTRDICILEAQDNTKYCDSSYQQKYFSGYISEAGPNTNTTTSLK